MREDRLSSLRLYVGGRLAEIRARKQATRGYKPVLAGDVVRLNSGGPAMLVRAANLHRVLCVWLAGRGRLRATVLSPACVTVVLRTYDEAAQN